MSRISPPARPRNLVPSLFIALACMAAGTSTLAAPAATAAPAAAAASAPKPLGYERLNRKKTPPKPVKLVDINSAGKAELKTLTGIGDAEADKIIAARPYLSKAELVSKNVLLTGPYLSLKNQVVALQKNPPKPKPKSKT